MICIILTMSRYSWIIQQSCNTESWKQHLLCNVKTISWGGVGGDSTIYYRLLFQNTSLDTISIFFVFVLTWLNFVLRLGGCSKVSRLPNRLSSYVFFFLVNKRFKPEIDFNYKKPQVLRWWHLKHSRKPIAYFSYHQKKTKSHY